MLTNHIRLASESTLTSPEDILFSSLGVIFPDDITNQHGSSDSSIIYLSPAFGDIELSLADPKGEDNRRLFSHFLWNAGVQLAVFIEREGGDGDGDGKDGKNRGEIDISRQDNGSSGVRKLREGINWSVKNEDVLELGAGTGLAGILAALKGASEVVISDYPAPEVLANITANVERNISKRKPKEAIANVLVQGHEWGVFSDPFSISNKGKFGRILLADCLWMPWQHGNLLHSVRWFLRPEGRAWVVAGFHTGREKMRGFFEEEVLKGRGLEAEFIWERDALGNEREWVPDRGREDVTERKRWLVVAVLRRVD